eukprot:1965195-Rhodomonas_salina.1
MDKAVAKRFMDHHSSKGTVENMEQRAHLAWRLLKEDIPRSELFVQYLRASALSCYRQFTEALKLEIEDKESLGEYGNMTCR